MHAGSSLAAAAGGAEQEVCLRVGQLFFHPQSGAADIVGLALASVRSLKKGGSQVATADKKGAQEGTVSKKELEEAAQKIPLTGESGERRRRTTLDPST